MELECNVIFNCFVSVGICFLLSFMYVGSLYIWKTPLVSDHPETIKNRFISVSFMLFIAPSLMYLGTKREILEKHSLPELLGIRREGLLQAIFIPISLTAICFLGPIVMKLYLSQIFREKTNVINYLYKILATNLDLITLRNLVVAPISEEFTFRCCMLPLLLQCLSPMNAVFLVPFFFGAAHLHHCIEMVKSGVQLRTALPISCFQFAFTTIFGIYSAYVFLRTRHFISIFLVHAFCNFMGVPNIIYIRYFPPHMKLITILLFFVGFFLWCYLLNPLTEPRLYYNNQIWALT